MFKLSLASFEEFSSLLHEAVEKITAKINCGEIPEEIADWQDFYNLI